MATNTWGGSLGLPVLGEGIRLLLAADQGTATSVGKTEFAPELIPELPEPQGFFL